MSGSPEKQAGATQRPARKKPGRPTKLTAEVRTAFLKLVRDGKTKNEACRSVRVSKEAVDDLRERDDRFHRQLARATIMGAEASLEYAEERLKRSTNKKISVDRELAHHYRWKASKLIGAYKDKVDIDLKADVQVQDNGPGKKTKPLHEAYKEMTVDEKIRWAKSQELSLNAIASHFRDAGLTHTAEAFFRVGELLLNEVTTQIEGPKAPLALPAPSQTDSPPSRARDSESEVVDGEIVI